MLISPNEEPDHGPDLYLGYMSVTLQIANDQDFSLTESRLSSWSNFRAQELTSAGGLSKAAVTHLPALAPTDGPESEAWHLGRAVG